MIVILYDLRWSCIYLLLFCDLHPITSPNLHQNHARGAAVRAKAYKILTGATLHLEAKPTKGDSVFLSSTNTSLTGRPASRKREDETSEDEKTEDAYNISSISL